MTEFICPNCEYVGYIDKEETIPISKIQAKIKKIQKEVYESDYIMEDYTESDSKKLILWELEDLLPK